MRNRTIRSARLPNPQCTSPKRSGFTLLELTLALGLTIVLLTAVYRAMEIHWQFSVAGQIEVERSQIARALLSRISADIRSTVYRVEETTASTVSDDTDTSDTTDSQTEIDDLDALDVTDPADAFSTDATGVFGDGQSLVLHISRPAREKESPSGDSTTTAPAGDLKSVSYFLAGSDARIAATVTSTLTSTPADDGIEGLARMSGDRFAVQQASQSGESPESVSQVELLAPEINHLSFEYHDGYEWLTEWDSTVEGRLPAAIGITIGFREPDFPENSFLRRTASESTDTYRLVVPLPAANPFEGVSY